MLSKLIEDRYLTLPIWTNDSGLQRAGFDNSLPNTAAGTIVDIPDRHYAIEMSTGVFTKTSQVVQLNAPRSQSVHRNFRWLPYIPGKITRMPLLGADILTGTMTGCWLVVINDNGTDYAVHIGTRDDPNTYDSKRVKAAWTAYMKNPDIIVRSGWKPDGAGFQRPLKSKRVQEHNREVEIADQTINTYGLFSGGENYTVYLAPQGGGMVNQRNRIVEYHKIPSPPISTLRSFPMGQ